jgi:hypothetical protein
VELFRLAHAKEWLQDYTDTINEQWPDHLARRFHKLVLLFDRAVRQFPKWREFVRNAESDRLTPERAAAVPSLATEFVRALRDEDAREFVHPSLPAALEILQAPLQSEKGHTREEVSAASALVNSHLPEDIVESINNIAKLAVEAALVHDTAETVATTQKATPEMKVGGLRGLADEMASGYATEARKSLVKEAKQAGKDTGPFVRKWVKRVIFGGGAFAALIQLSPTAFRWLEAIKPFLGLH